MDKWIEYAPWLLVAFLFFKQNRMFVTPEQITEKFVSFEQHLEEKFVQKETYSVAIAEIKSDIAEMKEKLDKIYEKLTKG